jgi:hypothetical protein
MQRAALPSLVALAVTLVAGPVMAQPPAPTTSPPAPPASPMPPIQVIQREDCPRLIDQIDRDTNIRFDPAAANAKVVAVQARKLQADGKYTECVRASQDALASLGIKQ